MSENKAPLTTIGCFGFALISGLLLVAAWVGSHWNQSTQRTGVKEAARKLRIAHQTSRREIGIAFESAGFDTLGLEVGDGHQVVTRRLESIGAEIKGKSPTIGGEWSESWCLVLEDDEFAELRIIEYWQMWFDAEGRDLKRVYGSVGGVLIGNRTYELLGSD